VQLSARLYERAEKARTTAESLAIAMRITESALKQLQSVKSGCVPFACRKEQVQIVGTHWPRPTFADGADLIASICDGKVATGHSGQSFRTVAWAI
jgi:hypothetical protein